MDRDQAREFLAQVCYDQGDPYAHDMLKGPSLSHIQTGIVLEAIMAAYKKGWDDQCDVVAACLV